MVLDRRRGDPRPGDPRSAGIGSDYQKFRVILGKEPNWYWSIKGDQEIFQYFSIFSRSAKADLASMGLNLF